MQKYACYLICLCAVALVSGCQKTPTPAVVTPQDVEAAKHEAQREVSDARAEASKGVKSAAKVSGSDSAVIHEAKVTAAYDISMAKADGDHKVATKNCLTLSAPLQPACQQQADTDFESTASAAKASRVANRQ